MEHIAETIPAVLALGARRHPDRALIVAEDGTRTYGELARQATSLARLLQRLGVEPGDRVGVLLPNGHRWLTAYVAVHTAGAAVVPLNTWYRTDDLADVVERARAKVLVAQRDIFGHDFEEDVSTLLSRSPEDHRPQVVWWDPDDSLPLDLRPLEAVAAIQALEGSPVRPDSEALLVFTSGSTARPKAVPLLQQGLVGQGRAIGDRQGVDDTDRFWLATPLFFVFACANAVPNALVHGATLCVQERFEPDEALAWIETHRCTVYYGVGPMARALATHPDLAVRDISSLRKGTGNATEEDLRLIIEVLGVSGVCNAYGLSEGYGHSTITHWSDPVGVRIRSQGTPLPTQELRIVDDEGGPVEAGVVGNVQIRGTITPGYLDEELNATAFTADGWFDTGDLGDIDSGGVLTYRGRKSEAMRINGIMISPAEIEGLLLRHPDVDLAYVFSVPTPSGEDAVAAVVVARMGADATGLPDALTAWARERVARYKVPTRFVVTTQDSLPLTPTGKVSKKLLRESRAW